LAFGVEDRVVISSFILDAATPALEFNVPDLAVIVDSLCVDDHGGGYPTTSQESPECPSSAP
jgi:hypothetical protein